jgi:3-hydroxyacyl-CoA dehydrogenase
MIGRVAVIGAGTMGSGIAAHVARAGVPVVLLDLDGIAQAAVERAGSPPLITPGSLENDLDLVGDADWLVEAVVEDIEIKRGLYRRLEGVRKPGSMVSSNTSTIPVSELLAGAPDGLRPDFAVTHFFNPPRTMRLLELAAGAETRPEVVERLTEFADLVLGKTVIGCRDTPAFIANRLGCFWVSCAVAEALAHGLTVAEADAAISQSFGAPRLGVFGLLDLVGIPLYRNVTASLDRLLRPDDAWHRLAHQRALLERMAAGGARFYRDGGQIDLATLEYGPACPPPEGNHHGYSKEVLSRTLAYACGLVPSVTDSVSRVDLAMELGFGWKEGPFGLIDRLGASELARRLGAEGLPVPPVLDGALRRGGFYDAEGRELGPDGSFRRIPRPEGIRLRDVRRQSAAVLSAETAALWDLGDGVACLEPQGKLNVLGPPTLELVERVATEDLDFRALVVYSDAGFFSAGANLAWVLKLLEAEDVTGLERLLGTGQRAFASLKFAPFPVVGAPAGICFGGGCEILLHCDAIQAHTDSTIGLVETRVGIVPGWGGCKEMLLRAFEHPAAGGPMPPVREVFELIAAATVSSSAAEARELGYLRPGDRVTPNRDRLLGDAKRFALELADGYVPPEPRSLRLPGRSGRATLALDVQQRSLRGGVTEHDRRIADELAAVLTGGGADVLDAVSESDVLSLERQANLALLTTGPTHERLAHMLANGKPLRN